MADYNWIAENATVYVLGVNRSGSYSHRRETITRVTKAQVILSDGSRWRLDSLRPVGESYCSGYESWRYELVPGTDERMAVSVAQMYWSRVTRALHEEDRKSPTSIAGIITALDVVAKHVDAARKRLTEIEAARIEKGSE